MTSINTEMTSKRLKIMSRVSLLLLVLAYYSLGTVVTGLSGCVTFDDPVVNSAISATTEEAKSNLATRVFGDIIPPSPKLAAAEGDVSANNGLAQETTLRSIYTSTAKYYNQHATERGYKQYLENLDEILLAKTQPCNGSSQQEELQLIQTFVSEYASNDTWSSNNQLLRSLYGKLLCYKDSNTHNRKRREDREPCECPETGLNTNFSDHKNACVFFACLIKDVEVIKNIFFGLDYVIQSQCLAFVIDTTGSMSDEIDTAKRVILDFLRSEQEIGLDGCYVLVPFNDVEGNPFNESMAIARESVGPVTFTYSFDPETLFNFYSSVENLQAGYIHNRFSHGGDRDEYCLYAILECLKATHYKDKFHLMTKGSQIIVLTDAPSKQKELEQKVIHIAKQQNNCIHFFVSEDADHYQDGIYQSIANNTHGTLLDHFDHWDIARFAAEYETNHCNFLERARKKRSSDRCKTFSVSRLAINLRLSIGASTGSILTITHPNGTTSVLTAGTNDLTFFNQTKPANGTWSVCTDSGSIKITNVTTYQIAATVLHISGNKSYIPYSAPSTCSTGKIVLIMSSHHQLIQSVSLDILDESGEFLDHINLTKGCNGGFVSGIVNFPVVSYQYHVVGRDIEGYAFQFDIKRQIKSHISQFLFSSIGNQTIEMDNNEDLRLQFDLKSEAMCDTNFSFSGNVPKGFAYQLTPQHAFILAGKSVKVEMVLRVTGSFIGESTHMVNVSAVTGGGQEIKSPSRMVTISMPTEPPILVDECGGCENGGVCKILFIRMRRITRCICPDGYGGQHCHVYYK